jgi:hypothetical protein
LFNYYLFNFTFKSSWWKAICYNMFSILIYIHVKALFKSHVDISGLKYINRIPQQCKPCGRFWNYLVHFGTIPKTVEGKDVENVLWILVIPANIMGFF